MKGLVLKPVLVLVLLAGFAAGEGSGDESGGLLEDLEDLEDLDDYEGSGEFGLLTPVEEKPGPTLNLDIEYTVQTNSSAGDDLEYYDDVYPDYDDFLNNYENVEDEYEVRHTDNVEVDSVFKKPEDMNDIEIRPKPGAEEEDEFILETSQIFIMVGSAFVSFAIVMLTFFLCRRMVATKAEKKRIPYTISPQKKIVKESSIVKDYQKVPTSTKEFLQAPKIEMYREEGSGDNPAAAPFVP